MEHHVSQSSSLCGRSCRAGERAELRTIWEPAGAQDGCQRFPAAAIEVASGCLSAGLRSTCPSSPTVTQAIGIGDPGQLLGALTHRTLAQKRDPAVLSISARISEAPRLDRSAWQPEHSG
jgi:hypothetical protein